MMKSRYWAVVLVAVAPLAAADCDAKLYGHWQITHTAQALDSGLQSEDTPMSWTFTSEGKATIDVPPFLNKTNDFECDGNRVTIKKMVPMTQEIVRLDDRQLVWQEQGRDKFFYFARK